MPSPLPSLPRQAQLQRQAQLLQRQRRRQRLLQLQRLQLESRLQRVQLNLMSEASDLSDSCKDTGDELYQQWSDVLNLSKATGDEEVEEVGIGGKGTGEAEMEGGGNQKTTPGVTVLIASEDILQPKGMGLKDAAKNLDVSRSTLQHHLISQSHPYGTPAVVDQEGIPRLNTDTLPSKQALAATVDTNNVVVGEGTEEGATTEGQLYSGSLGKRKRKKHTSGGERRNITAGVKIDIPLEDIVQMKGEKLEVAAMNLNVSRSTLKRACRDYGIHRWPPREKKNLINQPCPEESSAVVHQEGTPKLKSDILPSDQALAATVETNSVSVKARYENNIIVKFWLSWPSGMAELEQQVEKRLKLEAGTYRIRYRDEDDDFIVIACDEDLKDYISRSRPLGTGSVEVFVDPK